MIAPAEMLTFHLVWWPGSRDARQRKIDFCQQKIAGGSWSAGENVNI